MSRKASSLIFQDGRYNGFVPERDDPRMKYAALYHCQDCYATPVFTVSHTVTRVRVFHDFDCEINWRLMSRYPNLVKNFR
jgi:hypothetical protein